MDESRPIGRDRLHKTINWTTLVGVAVTAALGYFADTNRGKTDEKIAAGTAERLAALRAEQRTLRQAVDLQAEQIARLREAVAVLNASRSRSRAAVGEIDELLEAPAAPRASPTPDGGAQAEDAVQIKKQLLAE